MSQTPFVRRKFTINIRGAGGTTRFTFIRVERAITWTIRSRNPPVTDPIQNTFLQKLLWHTAVMTDYKLVHNPLTDINESCIPVDSVKLTEFHHLVNISNRTVRNSEESMHTKLPL